MGPGCATASGFPPQQGPSPCLLAPLLLYVPGFAAGLGGPSRLGFDKRCGTSKKPQGEFTGPAPKGERVGGGAEGREGSLGLGFGGHVGLRGLWPRPRLCLLGLLV